MWVPKASGHGPRGPFRVAVADREDPITRGLGDFEADDELYAGLAGDSPIHVLAAARSDKTGRDEPMAWTRRLEGGRVFALLLGHDARAQESPGYRALLARGAEWAASGKVETSAGR